MVIFQRKNLLQLRAVSGFQLIPYIKFAYDYIADEVIRQLLSPKGILIVDLSYSYCKEFFTQILENQNLFQILGLTGSFIEGA